jgi:hypothetical protein
MTNGTDTVIGEIPEGSGTISAGSGTIIHFSDRGRADFIAYARGGDCGKGSVVDGEYGIDGTGQPENKGRLIIKGKDIPYGVMGGKDGFHTYHLSYLALTTVEEDKHRFGPYATKATSSDGKQLVIISGKIQIGDILVSPSSYGLTGDVSVALAEPTQQVKNPGSAIGQDGSTQTPKIPGKSSFLFIGLGITGAVIVIVLPAVFFISKRKKRVAQD